MISFISPPDPLSKQQNHIKAEKELFGEGEAKEEGLMPLSGTLLHF